MYYIISSKQCAPVNSLRRKSSLSEHTHTLSCLAILVVFNFCWILQQTRQVAPALCSAERGQRGAGQMALSTMFSHRFHCHSRPDRSPLSQQRALSSVKVMAHMNEERELLMVPAQITQANKEPETDNHNQRTHEWPSRPFPLYHTYLLLLPDPAVCFHLRTPATFKLGCLDPHRFVALNSTAELSQWREAKWLACNGHHKIKQGRGELWKQRIKFRKL